MPSNLLKNSFIFSFSFPLAGSSMITLLFFILCIITKWLNPSSVTMCAIAGKVNLLIKPDLSTRIALVSNPNLLAPFSKPLSVVPLISVPRISLSLVIVISFL